MSELVYDNVRQVWHATLTVQKGTPKYLGQHATRDEAHRARCEGARKHIFNFFDKLEAEAAKRNELAKKHAAARRAFSKSRQAIHSRAHYEPTPSYQAMKGLVTSSEKLRLARQMNARSPAYKATPKPASSIAKPLRDVKPDLDREDKQLIAKMSEERHKMIAAAQKQILQLLTMNEARGNAPGKYMPAEFREQISRLQQFIQKQKVQINKLSSMATNPGIYECTLCRQPFSRKTDLQDHLRREHNTVTQSRRVDEGGKLKRRRKWQTTSLEEVVDSMSPSKHLEYTESTNASGWGLNGYVCGICHQSFYSYRGASIHAGRAHKDISKVAIHTREQPTKRLPVYVGSPYTPTPSISSKISRSLSRGMRADPQTTSDGLGTRESPVALESSDDTVSLSSDEPLEPVPALELPSPGSRSSDDVPLTFPPTPGNLSPTSNNRKNAELNVGGVAGHMTGGSLVRMLGISDISTNISVKLDADTQTTANVGGVAGKVTATLAPRRKEKSRTNDTDSDKSTSPMYLDVVDGELVEVGETEDGVTAASIPILKKENTRLGTKPGNDNRFASFLEQTNTRRRIHPRFACKCDQMRLVTAELAHPGFTQVICDACNESYNGRTLIYSCDPCNKDVCRTCADSSF